MRPLVVLLPLVLLACDPYPVHSPASPAEVTSAPAIKAASEPVNPKPVPIVFAELFLDSHDLPADMQSLKSVAESRPHDSIFLCFGGPGGKESAVSEWGDPHSNEPLWRIVDLRWVFDDEAGARAFHTKTIAHLETKNFKVAPCTVDLGDTCSRAYSGDWNQRGEPHIEIGYLFRIGNVLAEVSAGEGPRIGKQRITDEMVLPMAKRAEQRVRAALIGR